MNYLLDKCFKKYLIVTAKLSENKEEVSSGTQKKRSSTIKFNEE